MIFKKKLFTQCICSIEVAYLTTLYQIWFLTNLLDSAYTKYKLLLFPSNRWSFAKTVLKIKKKTTQSSLLSIWPIFTKYILSLNDKKINHERKS